MIIWKSKPMWAYVCLALFIVGTLANISQASECEDISRYLPAGQKCSTGSEGWDPLSKLDEIGTKQTDQSQAGSTNWPQKSRQYRWNQTDLDSENASMPSDSSSGNSGSIAPRDNKSLSNELAEKSVSNFPPKRSDDFYAMMAPLSNASQFDVILDVSSGVRKFIPGAVNIDYLDFQDENGNLRPAAELAKILGVAGISRNDSVLIYGECSCTLGPSISTYAYWVMRYLGHNPNKLRVLDGGLVDWAAANHSVANQSTILPKANYSFEINPEVLATYEEVKSAQDGRSGQTKLVDVRPLQDYINGSISNKAISMPFDKVILDGKLKDESELKRIFSIFPKDSSVIVYSKQGVQASLMWFSLEMMGHHSKLYTLMDWQERNDQINNTTNQNG